MRLALTTGLLRRGWLKRGLLAAALGLGGCAFGANKPVAPQPARAIDASLFFTGRWYEIARTPMDLTKNCVAGTTDYFRNADGLLMDRDACRMDTPDGRVKTFEGPVSFDGPDNNKVTVHYIVYGFIPVAKHYWMLDHGADYSWFIVTDPAFDMLSIFTRAPRPGAAEIATLTSRAGALGYDTAKLEYPAQFPPGQR